MSAECSDIFARLESWYASTRGQYALRATRGAVQDTLDRTFGYHILQLGISGEHALCQDSPINHRIICADEVTPNTSLRACAHELPLESDSVDAVIAHHCLEFSEKPHQALREIQRVLTPQGQLLVIGFNPFSLAGLGHTVRRLGGHSLWQHHVPLSESRLTDWLHLVGFEVEDVYRLYWLPPAGSGRFRQAMTRIDDGATRHNLPCGGLYVFHAVKQVAGTHRPQRVLRAPGRALAGLVPKPSPAPSPNTLQGKSSDNLEKESISS